MFIIYTLKKFLENNPFDNINIITQFKDFSKTYINSVSVIEMPIDNFVKPNDIVLSTAIGCIDDNEKLKKFILDIKNSKAAAIFLTFKNPLHIVSEDIIVFSNKIDMPVFTIPWELHFSEISKFIISKIHDEKIENYKTIQNELFDAYFTSKTLDKAAQIISNFTKTSVEITDKEFTIKGYYNQNKKCQNFDETEIRINTFLWGYLRIYDTKNCRVTLDKKYTEKYIGSTLSLWFNKENVENMFILKLKNDFVWNLANKNYDSFDEMMYQGLKLGFNLNLSYTCVIFKVIPQSNKNSINEYSYEAVSCAVEIENAIIEQHKKNNMSIMFANRGLMFILYIQNTAPNPQLAIDEYIDVLEKKLFNIFPDFNIKWGLSETTVKPVPFEKLYKNASLSLNYCINSKNKKYRFTYNDAKIFQIVSVIQNNKEIKAFAENVISILLIHDKSSDMNLFDTLIEYIKCNYNTSLTSRNLHIHRQSLLYRLNKIESLTGMSLNKHSDLFLLEIFTRIYSDY